MTKQVNRNDLETAILDVVRKMNIENAIHSVPVYSLTEILEFKNVTTLRKIGKKLHVKYYGKLPKPALIPAIAENLMQTKNLRNCLYTLDEQEWNFFQEAASQVNYQADVVFDDWYTKAQGMGLLQCFYHDDELYYVVPNEIKAGYTELASTDFLEDQNLRILINNYAVAAVNLYGVISQDQLADIFNSQNALQISVDDIFKALLPYVCTDAAYCFWGTYIVDYDFAGDDYESVPLLVAVRKGKPRYTPPKEEFLKYSDWDYYETTPQLLSLKAALSEYISDPELVLDVLEEIHDMCAADARIQDFFDLLNSAGVTFSGMSQVEVLAQQIMDVKNNTRLWANYGHTPSELFSADKSNLIPFPSRPASVAKIGRNDPCPCGSGKKYKQCCGR